jgi:phospholipase/carboxylesterase
MTDFIHRFEPGANPAGPTLLLLHGTGGDENDLIALGREVCNWNLLSPRGQVSEGGAGRWFRRLREGVFDEDDVRLRANELADWLIVAAQEYSFDADSLYALGYSNGANIAAAMLMLRPETLRGAVLWRAMLPLQMQGTMPQSLTGRRVLMLSGQNDMMAPRDSTHRLANWLRVCGADVTHTEHAGGHNLQRTDIEETRVWLAQAA